MTRSLHLPLVLTLFVRIHLPFPFVGDRSIFDTFCVNDGIESLTIIASLLIDFGDCLARNSDFSDDATKIGENNVDSSWSPVIIGDACSRFVDTLCVSLVSATAIDVLLIGVSIVSDTTEQCRTFRSITLFRTERRSFGTVSCEFV